MARQKKIPAHAGSSDSGKSQDLDVALFRYGQIAPVLNGTFDGSAAEYYRRATQSEVEVPHNGLRSFKPNTLKSWLNDYRAGGIDALMPRLRCDCGQSRVILPEVEDRLRELLSEKPKLTGSMARSTLVDEGLIISKSPSASTIRRFIRSQGLRLKHASKRERRAWAKRDVNELWTLDFKHGPKIGKVKTRLLAIIDDASRFIVLGCVLPSESYAELAPRLLAAFMQHGLPKALYCDNGSAFSCRDLALACARLDIALIHSKPYDPESRGKIERFFLTVEKRFLDPLDAAVLDSVVNFDRAFDGWIDTDYHRRVHSSIETTPLARFLESTKPRRWVSRQQLDTVFYRTIHRKVRKDCTVSIRGRSYEVGAEWIGHTVELRSPLDEPNTFILFASGEPTMTLKPLDVLNNDRCNARARFATKEITVNQDHEEQS